MGLHFRSLNEASRFFPSVYFLVNSPVSHAPPPLTHRRHLHPKLLWTLPWSPRHSTLLSQIMGLPTLHSGPIVPLACAMTAHQLEWGLCLYNKYLPGNESLMTSILPVPQGCCCPVEQVNLGLLRTWTVPLFCHITPLWGDFSSLIPCSPAWLRPRSHRQQQLACLYICSTCASW